MKHRRLTLILICIVLVILFAIEVIIHTPPSPHYYNHIPLTRYSKNTVVNTTPYKYMDTVVIVGLDNLNVHGVSVVIQKLDADSRKLFANSNELDLSAAIVGNKKQFVIYVSEANSLECIPIISHELIHLVQYNRGRLQIVSPTDVLWEGTRINVNDYSYEDRPWEKEAYEKEVGLSQKIKSKLY